MKKTIYHRCLCIVVLAMCITLSPSGNLYAKEKKPKSRKEQKQNTPQERETFTKDVYMFGVARNYMDSVTYLTEITHVKNVIFDKQTGFADGLNLYTTQMEDYLASQEHIGYLCATFYASTRKKAEKMYIKIRKKSEKKNFTHVEPMGDFKFKFVSSENIYRNMPQASEEEN